MEDRPCLSGLVAISHLLWVWMSVGHLVRRIVEALILFMWLSADRERHGRAIANRVFAK